MGIKKYCIVVVFSFLTPLMSFTPVRAALPDHLDWRNYGGNNYVTPVRDQGSCGSCWAFASTAALESKELISANKPNFPGTLMDLSEQELVSCSGAGNCNGGTSWGAANYMIGHGIGSELCMPYQVANGVCSNECRNVYKLSAWQQIHGTNGGAPAKDDIRNALYAYGPVTATISVFSDLDNYTGGVYYHQSGNYAGEHVVLVVGYDETGQYFICKNSWGTWWGESGYFRIGYSQITNNVGFGGETIAYGTAILPAQPSIMIGPDPVSLTASIGTASGKDLYLTNTGGSSLTVRDILLSNEGTEAVIPGSLINFFWNVDNCAWTSIAPFTSCYMNVGFRPITPGTKSGHIVFDSTDPDVSWSATVPLIGNATIP